MNNPHYCPQCREELETVSIEGKDRLACPAESCEYVFWDPPTIVVAAITEYDDCIILARNKAWPEKMFGLITGFLEKGETPEEGIIREVREELGLDGEITGFIGNYSFFEMNQLIIAYHILAQGDLQPGEELAEVRKVPVEKLKPWPFGTGPAVRDWLATR